MPGSNKDPSQQTNMSPHHSSVTPNSGAGSPMGPKTPQSPSRRGSSTPLSPQQWQSRPSSIPSSESQSQPGGPPNGPGGMPRYPHQGYQQHPGMPGPGPGQGMSPHMDRYRMPHPGMPGYPGPNGSQPSSAGQSPAQDPYEEDFDDEEVVD